jgi:hypothetical protein
VDQLPRFESAYLMKAGPPLAVLSCSFFISTGIVGKPRKQVPTLNLQMAPEPFPHRL